MDLENIFLNFDLLQAVKEEQKLTCIQGLMRLGACLDWCEKGWSRELLHLYDTGKSQLVIQLLQTESAVPIRGTADTAQDEQQKCKAILLFEAAFLKDEKTAKSLLQLGAEPMLEVEQRNFTYPISALSAVVYLERVTFVELMLDYVDTTSPANQRIMLVLVDEVYRQHKRDMVLILIQMWVKLSQLRVSPQLGTLMLMAIRENQFTTVKYLQECDIDPFIECKDEDTGTYISPLRLAACMGKEDIIKMLIVAAPDINLLRNARMCLDSVSYSGLSSEMKEWIHEHSSSPWPLQQLCRNAIRRCIKPRYPVSAYTSALGVPKLIQEYIDLCELDEYHSDL